MSNPIFAWGMIAASVALLLRVVSRATADAESKTVRLQHFPETHGDGATAFQKFDAWFVRLCYFFDGGISPLTVALGIGMTAIVVAIVVFMISRDPLLAIIASIASVAALLAIMSIIRKRALKKFTAQFPAALELFSRAIRAGESVDLSLIHI